MKVNIVVTPRSGKDGVAGWKTDSAGQRELSVCVRTAPEGGKATSRACEVVADSIGIAKSRVRCVRGATSRHKQLEVDCDEATLELWRGRLGD